MPPEEHMVEFKRLSYKTNNDTVLFDLEDGTVVAVKVSLRRVGIAVNYKNPDGSSHYAVDTKVDLSVTPAEKTFMIPKSMITPQQAKPPEKQSHIA